MTSLHSWCGMLTFILFLIQVSHTWPHLHPNPLPIQLSCSPTPWRPQHLNFQSIIHMCISTTPRFDLLVSTCTSGNPHLICMYTTTTLTPGLLLHAYTSITPTPGLNSYAHLNYPNTWPLIHMHTSATQNLALIPWLPQHLAFNPYVQLNYTNTTFSFGLYPHQYNLSTWPFRPYVHPNYP